MNQDKVKVKVKVKVTDLMTLTFHTENIEPLTLKYDHLLNDFKI